MEYGMVSTLIPKEYEEKFHMEAKNTMQDAASVLQWNLYHGLSKNLNRDIPIFNILPCGSFPQYCKNPFIPHFYFSENGQNLAFCNIKLIRNCFKTAALKKALISWCRSNYEPKTLFIYTVSQPLLSAVSKMKKKYPEVHVCAIVADLPDMSNLSSKKSLVLKIFSSYRAKCSYALLSFVDSFVLLTEHMAEYMNITKPYCVVEGIATKKNEYFDVEYAGDHKIIFYAGTLHKRFGVLNLVEAFSLIDSPDYELILCGIGDCEDEIRDAAKKDSRINFYGQLPRKEVLKLQTKATVLVNPRCNNEEFTKYSFPSKNLEYLSSGVPVIAYKLDGIPDEYDEYILYVKDNSPSSLANKIIEICEMSNSERASIGNKARSFVNRDKNEIVQTQKILSLIEKERIR